MNTKTVTVLASDVDDTLDRWVTRGWEPVSATTFDEPNPMRPNVAVTYAVLVFARMGKPK